ncbi:hypothetical protein GGS23DRAFT_557275 [Durotheca rogersii]|uniref:uncharacterized protein n=1 Tax=Durotheca rogersii TaxID=419775 RepID=UPI00222011AC|nr:uncharacterized protein GGS23DRAFT_557275 [Durotheca rogersii]KAI5865016.1 hypothetical protein GGS23DRAFT_557275 [Durotheca rogersii]
MAASPELGPGHFPVAFRDFDLRDVFDQTEAHVVDGNSRNFVVEFGYEKARIAFDLGVDDVKRLLDQDPDERHYPIRWINIWDSDAQKGVVAAIGDRYGFSPRLLGLMTASRPQQDDTRRQRDRRRPISLRRGHRDPEKGRGDGTNGTFPLGRVSRPGLELNDNLALYLQVKDTVNYFSTDQTRKAFCIGANWLHKRPAAEFEHHRTSIMPPKHWQWLALCNNHTVLSIHERPSFEPVPEKEDEQRWRDAELRSMRSHTLDVLLQLSRVGFDLYKENPLAQISVRESLRKLPLHRQDLSRQQSGMSLFTNSELGSLADEGTSNLFYYLFEDYVAAGPLKTAERELENATHEVLENTRRNKTSKSSDIIPTLHYLSKDLRELKHLFENYRNLIRKIMTVGKVDVQPGGQLDGSRRFSLTNSALSRFERLGDRLQFLMLNTIEGFLEEIAALSTTYFNLTQQKDSQATARLTRSATLLAKLSVFFLPISFMTSYFSVQIEDLYLYWTAKTYWYAFAVIASVSFVSLFFFSRLLMFFSDVLDGWAAKIADWSRALVRVITRGVLRGDDDNHERM